MANVQKPEPKNSRWWENYVVRYFIGTVFGAGIAVFLTTYPASPLNGSLQAVAGLQEATFKDIGVFASIGFAFCYVASAPILTIHTLREHMRVQRVTENAWRWFVLITIIVGAFWLTVEHWFTG